MNPVTLSDEPQSRLIMDLVKAEPGTHVREIARRTDMSLETCRSLVTLLVRAGILVTRKIGALDCLFTIAEAPASTAKPLVLRSAIADRIARRILANPGATSRELAESLDMSCTVVHTYLKSLEEEGLVHRARVGSALLVVGSDALVLALGTETKYGTSSPHPSHAQDSPQGAAA